MAKKKPSAPDKFGVALEVLAWLHEDVGGVQQTLDELRKRKEEADASVERHVALQDVFQFRETAAKEKEEARKSRAEAAKLVVEAKEEARRAGERLLEAAGEEAATIVKEGKAKVQTLLADVQKDRKLLEMSNQQLSRRVNEVATREAAVNQQEVLLTRRKTLLDEREAALSKKEKELGEAVARFEEFKKSLLPSS